MCPAHMEQMLVEANIFIGAVDFHLLADMTRALRPKQHAPVTCHRTATAEIFVRILFLFFREGGWGPSFVLMFCSCLFLHIGSDVLA